MKLTDLPVCIFLSVTCIKVLEGTLIWTGFTLPYRFGKRLPGRLTLFVPYNSLPVVLQDYVFLK